MSAATTALHCVKSSLNVAFKVIHKKLVIYLTFTTFIFLYVFPLLFTPTLLFDFLYYYLFI
jgi:hypothetical protein